MANPWFRMYAEFLTDPKVQMLSETDQRRYIMLLCIRCNGHVTLQDDEVAFQLRISAEEWTITKRRLVEKNLVTDDNNPAAWEKRQYASDSSLERVRKHRNKKKRASNDDVTLQKQPDNAVDTDTDTDTDTDISSTNVLDVRSDAAEPAAPVADTKKLPSCPHQKVIDLYHESLPYCPQVREWNTTRQKYLQSRWREKAVSLGWQKDAEGLEWFKRFFSFVGESKFLTGKADGRNGKPPFLADLEWLMRPSNFAKVVEGKYHQ